mgnify:CR=1 FL=1
MPDQPNPRFAALHLLQAVLRRRVTLEEAWSEALKPPGPLAPLAPRDRAFARLLFATAVRRLGQLDALLGQCLEAPLPAGALETDLLRLGAVQLLFLGTPPHAAVDGSVGLVPPNSRYRGLVNAVLRRIAREGAAMLAAQDAARLNTPDWLWQSWCAAYGAATTRAIAEAQLVEPPLDFSVKADAAGWATKLEASILPTGSLRRAAGGAIETLPGFADGAWWVQDAAAGLPARLFGTVAGRTVIDLCAAPGGKTAELAVAGARVIAVDRSPARVRRLAQNLQRLRLDVTTVTADAATWRPETPVDAVLLDAPCSATGTIRRHPDVARLKRPDDLPGLIATQDRLLAAAVEMLQPGGILVYCVCSLQPEEGPERIAALLAEDDRLARVPILAAEVGGLPELLTPAGDLRTLPCHLAALGGLDGFYAGRLRRT